MVSQEMKIYGSKNVFDMAIGRMRYLFDEFPNVVVTSSGGKDSTVILNLALMVAEEKGRLPLKVLFIDQEAEWQVVIDHMRIIMGDPRVYPMWFQIPMKIFNATSTHEPWLHCWEEGKEWMREKEPGSYRINKYGTDRFKEMFGAIIGGEFESEKTCTLSGVRCDESPSRKMGLTEPKKPKYTWITWGRPLKHESHMTFYPIYDWSLSDVWAAIEKNGWPYCKLYDLMHQFGLSTNRMRVSNIHHETAVHSLFFMQEIEPDTWDKAVRRLSGINTAGMIGGKDYFTPTQLPPMFSGWAEYRDYLLENLVTDQTIKDSMIKTFRHLDERYVSKMAHPEALIKIEINTILLNDFSFTKMSNFLRCPGMNAFRQSVERGKAIWGKHEQFVPDHLRANFR